MIQDRFSVVGTPLELKLPPEHFLDEGTWDAWGEETLSTQPEWGREYVVSFYSFRKTDFKAQEMFYGMLKLPF